MQLVVLGTQETEHLHRWIYQTTSTVLTHQQDIWILVHILCRYNKHVGQIHSKRHFTSPICLQNLCPLCVWLLVPSKNPWWQNIDTTGIPSAQANTSPGRTFRQQELKQKSCKLSTRLTGCLIERRVRSWAVRLPLGDDTLIRISPDSSQPRDIINKHSGECAAVINELWRLPNEWRCSVSGGGASLRNSNLAAPNWINELALCWMGQKNGLKLGELIKAFGPQSVHIYPG